MNNQKKGRGGPRKGDRSRLSLTWSPRRLASWWSVLDDLQWPQQKTRDKIRRRADELADAGVDTVIQFGFHCRFDFYPYFGLIHGLFADVAESLHARGIRFLDHYSCNVVARPRTPEELVRYHHCNRHHVAVHPDALAAETAGYAGHRFNDLREIDVGTGLPAYSSSYQAELLCCNHPGFGAMHAAYLRRQIAEIPLDGFQIDDMADYAWFRGCGCVHCRRRFRRECGHELPPLADKKFWGDTRLHPTEWGNYENPVFRDWVTQRYRKYADHLARVRRVIGPDLQLMTCCSHSGALAMNSLGLSYETHIGHCDWVMLENCGLTATAANWQRTETDAMLHKAIAARKNPSRPAPSIALSYSVYEDGAYLAWAVARFWGASNWFSTLSTALPLTPVDAKEDAELIGPLNRWEMKHSDLDPKTGRDVGEVRLAYTRAVRDQGWCDERGKDHWGRVEAWSHAFLKQDIGYRMLTAADLTDAAILLAEKTPLVLDSCVFLNPTQKKALGGFIRGGGNAWVVLPIGLALPDGGRGATMIAPAEGAGALPRLLRAGKLKPRIRRVRGPSHWRVRLRVHRGRLVMHLLNGGLRGIEHPTVVDRWLKHKVMLRLSARKETEPLVIDLDACDLPGFKRKWRLCSPELKTSRRVPCRKMENGRWRMTLNLRGLRIYGVLQDAS